tara:strand:+ start:1011 stop:1517 length:507 start_codon:yes stop_codon:yes gene_type:complete
MAEQAKPEQKQAPKQDSFKHIVRIANVDIPGEKSVRISLTKIKGVGINFADVACTLAGINKQKKTGNLTDTEISKLNDVVANPESHGFPEWMLNRRKDYETGEDKHLLMGTLNFTKDNDLKRLKKVKTLRGMRHQKGLPVRGQRTRSNFRKSKGKVVGVKKKGVPGKK